MAGAPKAKNDSERPDLWQEAYKALAKSEKGKERLEKLNNILRTQLGKPDLKIRSSKGHKELQTMINKKSQALATEQTSDKTLRIIGNMSIVKDIVGTGASAGGPFAAIPVAALFIAFSINQIYQAEKSKMFELAEKVAHYMKLHTKGPQRVTILPGDDAETKDFKKGLRMLYIGLYKSLLYATTEITIALHSDMQFVKNLFKHYDWEGQVRDLDKTHHMCKDYRDEWVARQNDPTLKRPDSKKSMGPGPRNPLHWAVVFIVPDQVTNLVQKDEYPINALTPQRWTALHLAAEGGNVPILKTLLTAPGIDLRIKNKDGSTPLHVAANRGRVWATKLLLQRDRGLLDIRDNKGKTAFLLASMKGHVKVLEVLKQNGQDFNQTTLKNGWTGLHMAAEEGHLEAAKFLLENGTNKNAQTKDGAWKGWDAKRIAERKKRLEIVAIL